MKLQKTQRVIFAILISGGMIFLCQDNATAGSMAQALEKAATTQIQTGAPKITHSKTGGSGTWHQADGAAVEAFNADSLSKH